MVDKGIFDTSLQQEDAEVLKEIYVLTGLRFQFKVNDEVVVNHNRVNQISIDDHSLEFLPESIGNLISLEELQLSNNKLKFLPESVRNLKSLKERWLDYNQIERLPE